jgi:hypothetical protein
MMDIFLVFTPLHTFICEAIIKNRNIEKYILVYASRNNIKNKYYFEKFSARAYKKYFIKTDKILFLIFNLFFISMFFRLRYQKINFYTGQIKTFATRFFLWCYKDFNLYSFDDGWGNINSDTKAYFRDDNENKCSKMFFSLLNKKFLYKNIKQRIINHYTIFLWKENVFENSIYVPLSNIVFMSKIYKKTESLNILLTSCEAEYKKMSLSQEKKIYEDIIEKYSIDKIIPHPVSKLNKFSEKYQRLLINNELIAEDIILSLLKENRIRLYGFNSTTLFVLSDISSDLEIFNLGKVSDFL